MVKLITIKVNTFTMILFITICMLLLVGCTSNDGASELVNDEYTDIAFEIVDIESIESQIILQWIDENYRLRGIYTKDFGQQLVANTYILIAEGEKPTGGYSIIVDKLLGNNQEIRVVTSLESPSKKELVSQGFTYPHLLLKIKQDSREIVLDNQ